MLTIKISLVLFKSVWIILKNLAKNKAVLSFASSVGWKLIGPIRYHDLAPPRSTPNINRLSNNKIETKYNSRAILSKKLVFVKIIIIKVTEDAIRKIICFPTIVELSKIDVNDSLKLEE